MYRSLLVPLDGSAFAEQALPFATSIVRRTGAAVRVVQVHVPVTSLFSGSEYGQDLTSDAGIRESETAYLDGVVKRFAEIVPSEVTRALADGSVADTLHEQALTVNADLVVMASHGRGGLSRFWLGSVADKLVRRLPMPILLVRPQEGAPNVVRDHIFRHILIPLDGSELAEQAVESAIAMGTVMDADYTLVRVIDPLQIAGHDADGLPISGLAKEGIEHLKKAAADSLDRIAERLRGRSLRVVTRVIVSCQAAEAILDQGGSPSTDLIALATHGHGGLTRLLLGSVADKVIRGALTPVLVHRPSEDGP